MEARGQSGRSLGLANDDQQPDIKGHEYLYCAVYRFRAHITEQPRATLKWKKIIYIQYFTCTTTIPYLLNSDLSNPTNCCVCFNVSN